MVGHDHQFANGDPIGPYKVPPRRFSLERLKFAKDYRRTLPFALTRFIGYRPLEAEPPYEPIPPLKWLEKIPFEYEVWVSAWIGAFGSILLIEAIMSTNTVFREAYHSPMIVVSFGASAVLLFGAIESPLAQPRNVILGHSLSAILATGITKLFLMNQVYRASLDNRDFYPSPFLNGGLSMATCLLLMLITGTTHPPAGATALGAAVEAHIVTLSWHYIPVIVVSCVVMLTWALIINNIGRRRYPTHWWAPGVTMVRKPLDELEAARQKREADAESRRERQEEGMFVVESNDIEDIRLEEEMEHVASLQRQPIALRSAFHSPYTRR
jgi:CBS-domain-containing membrane protein